MDKEQDKRLRKFLSKVRRKFEPERVLLFGSRARGDHLSSSDYNLAIISKKFRGQDFRERIIGIYELIDGPLNVEVLCYTPEEFERRRKELSIVRRIAEEGVAI